MINKKISFLLFGFNLQVFVAVVTAAGYKFDTERVFDMMFDLKELLSSWVV